MNKLKRKKSKQYIEYRIANSKRNQLRIKTKRKPSITFKKTVNNN